MDVQLVCRCSVVVYFFFFFFLFFSFFFNDTATTEIYTLSLHDALPIFLRRTRDQMEDRRDMQFMQNGRKVFKEVLPMVSAHILGHLNDTDWTADSLKRLWLHQANKTMNDFIGKKVLGRTPELGEQPNILQDYANTSSAGSIIAFSKHSSDMEPGDRGVICSFGAGYSVGSVLVERA